MLVLLQPSSVKPFGQLLWLLRLLKLPWKRACSCWGQLKAEMLFSAPGDRYTTRDQCRPRRLVYQLLFQVILINYLSIYRIIIQMFYYCDGVVKNFYCSFQNCQWILKRIWCQYFCGETRLSTVTTRIVLWASVQRKVESSNILTDAENIALSLTNGVRQTLFGTSW